MHLSIFLSSGTVFWRNGIKILSFRANTFIPEPESYLPNQREKVNIFWVVLMFFCRYHVEIKVYPHVSTDKD